DRNLSMDYLRARYLSFEVGRFYGRDPAEGDLESPSTLNKFEYGGADPVNHFDPNGLFLEEFSISGAIDSILNSTAQALVNFKGGVFSGFFVSQLLGALDDFFLK